MRGVRLPGSMLVHIFDGGSSDLIHVTHWFGVLLTHHHRGLGIVVVASLLRVTTRTIRLQYGGCRVRIVSGIIILSMYSYNYVREGVTFFYHLVRDLYRGPTDATTNAGRRGVHVLHGHVIY